MVRSRDLADQTPGKLAMYWQEQKASAGFAVPDDIIDLSFSIQCQALPVDHAHSLSQAILQALPWLAETGKAGIHQIHVANSQNGWMRPDQPDALLYLSKRTRMTLRLPKDKIKDAEKLCGQTLNVDGNELTVKQATTKPLSAITTLFSRYIAAPEEQTEAEFLSKIAEQLKSMGVQPRKMLCGTENRFRTPQGTLLTRSLMLADLELDESIILQQQGIGDNRLLGCGLFIPHKDINDIRPRGE